MSVLLRLGHCSRATVQRVQSTLVRSQGECEVRGVLHVLPRPYVAQRALSAGLLATQLPCAECDGLLLLVADVVQ